MFIQTATIIISSTTFIISPSVEQEIFYLDDNYAIVAQEYMRQRNNDHTTDIDDILYKTIEQELLRDKDKE